MTPDDFGDFLTFFSSATMSLAFFGFERDASTTIGCNAMNFGAHIHVPQDEF